MNAVIFPSRLAVRRRGALPEAAFSLLEMLVGMGILSILVLALFAMFNQTQKALLANVNQSDVMEGGRSVIDLIGRDLVRARPANLGTNHVFDAGTANILRTVLPATNLVIRRTPAGIADLTGRTNFLDGWRRDALVHDLFYLAEVRPGLWTGAGLFVAHTDFPWTNADFDVGTLFRYEDPNPVSLRGARGAEQAHALLDRFAPGGLADVGPDNNRIDSYRTNASRLVDGVVFFRATAFGPFGEALDPTFWRAKNPPQSYPGILIDPLGRTNLPVPATVFVAGAFPSALEIELGVLPAELLEKYRALPEAPPGIRVRFLARNVGNVLVFRQRIPMPTTASALP